jgi:hypothetical protein
VRECALQCHPATTSAASARFCRAKDRRATPLPERRVTPACTPEHGYDVADPVLGRAVARGLNLRTQRLGLRHGRKLTGALALKLSKLGVRAGMDAFTGPEPAAFATRVEAWGYGALLIPEAMGRIGLAAR